MTWSSSVLLTVDGFPDSEGHGAVEFDREAVFPAG